MSDLPINAIRQQALEYIGQLPELDGQTASGIYFLIENQEIVYIGQSVDIKRRIEQHRASGRFRIDKVLFKEKASEFANLDEEEVFWIATVWPLNNKQINCKKISRRNNSEISGRLDNSRPGPIEQGYCGLFLHTLDDTGRIKQQGRILRRIDGTKYLVELFSWIDGTPGKSVIIDLENPDNNISFYSTVEKMKWAFCENAAAHSIEDEGRYVAADEYWERQRFYEEHVWK
jgi:hypothetical protein